MGPKRPWSSRTGHPRRPRRCRRRSTGATPGCAGTPTRRWWSGTERIGWWAVRSAPCRTSSTRERRGSSPPPTCDSDGTDPLAVFALAEPRPPQVAPLALREAGGDDLRAAESVEEVGPLLVQPPAAFEVPVAGDGVVEVDPEGLPPGAAHHHHRRHHVAQHHHHHVALPQPREVGLGSGDVVGVELEEAS